MRRILASLTFACVVAVCSIEAFAWSDSGHKIIASIAFRQLTPDQQAKIAAIIKQHPRYVEDFSSQMPADLSEAEQNEWLFQRAAIWPDILRGFSGPLRDEYHKAFWHYITMPHYLTEEDRKAIEPTLVINGSIDPPAEETPEMNAVQAMRFERRKLAEADTPPTKRALYVCWLFHQVGDIHQPLHATTLYTPKMFPQGDRGGNLIKTGEQTAEMRFPPNLHGEWDQMMGDLSNLNDARDRAIALMANKEFDALGKAAATNLDEKVWTDESHSLGLSAVYTPEVISYVRVHETAQNPPMLKLSSEYVKNGQAISERRVVQAGYRLGAVLKEIAGK